MRVLLKNGVVCDGLGEAEYAADILIADDRILAVAPALKADGAETIDLTGLAVAPGFIDTHSHSDLLAMIEPEIPAKILQGVTSEIVGQDGVGPAPLPPAYIDVWRKNIAAFDGDSEKVDWAGFGTLDAYLSQVEKAGPGVNIAALAPHGNIRLEAMGLENRPPTAREMEQMREITRREMEAGAFGLSTGLIYLPCLYADTRELIELCRVVARYDGVFVTHQRSEADDIIASMEETLQIGRESGVRIHFSHFKVCGQRNWDKIGPALELLDRGRDEGLSITFDEYPYVAGCTMMNVILPPWVAEGGNELALKRLADAGQRRRMIEDIENGLPGWDNFIGFIGLGDIYVTGVAKERNQAAVGKSLTQLAEMTGQDPYNAIFDLLLDENNNVGMMDYYGLEDHIKRFIVRPEMNVCTDGCVGEAPHPRMFGSFPRVLGHFARDLGVLTLGQAVRKMSGQAALVGPLKDRGLIKPGYFADLVVFDPKTVIDRGTYEQPEQQPEGIKHVFVNGDLAVKDGRLLHRRNGRVLRRGEGARQ